MKTAYAVKLVRGSARDPHYSNIEIPEYHENYWGAPMLWPTAEMARGWLRKHRARSWYAVLLRKGVLSDLAVVEVEVMDHYE